MDTLRGQFSEPDVPFEEAGNTESDTPASVGRDERRMQVRAYNFWAGLLGERAFPHTDDLAPETIFDFGPNSVLLDFAEGIEDPIVRFVGATLAQECDLDTPIRTLAEVPSRSLLSRITDHYMQILANQAPIGFEAEFVNQRGETVLYRGILLPFARDDATIDAILGVINWKTLSAAEAQARAARGGDAPAQADESVPAMLRETTPMTEWADGPADEAFDIARGLELPALSLELPTAQFGLVDPADLAASAPTGFAPPAPRDLADWLGAAREEARLTRGCESRSREALYAAIGRAYDFALATEEAPDAYAELLAQAEITVQERAPLLPVAKLVFGTDYDKTRLTEFATAMAHGQRLGLARGGLKDLLATTPGGLKAVVRAERDLRRAEAGDASALIARHEELLAALRQMPPKPFEQSAQGSEFAVLVARRTPEGRLILLGKIDDDARLLDRAARHLLD
ncbi:PAS domain-containing protein [Novosphingobium decolorationis]|uniref:PAS domain-containing protein n=1 Tax=Novosphingobium decolorationis TaxID=2698673 RepID=A0ABX8E8J7_9SPHN|nr:hypothetical protein [Novosphingobium decolorationis]QVM84530.1 hypothetical protein HT578_13265 [Novosphingobium decolorationis]